MLQQLNSMYLAEPDLLAQSQKHAPNKPDRNRGLHNSDSDLRGINYFVNFFNVSSVITSNNKRYERLKRAIDISGSLFLLLILSPLLLIIAVLVFATSRGPIIFRQARLTKDEAIFTILKFRTMRIDAESQTGPAWAALNDNRVTSVGKFLRITRLDELPQLVNVLRGEMSLIGPRPERPEIAKELQKELPEFFRRHQVKAGISGYAQVASGYASSIESYKRKLAHDLYYIDNYGLILDIKIALKTIIVILTGSGAR